jgi:hypothetical protein
MSLSTAGLSVRGEQRLGSHRFLEQRTHGGLEEERDVAAVVPGDVGSTPVTPEVPCLLGRCQAIRRGGIDEASLVRDTRLHGER